MTIRLRSLSSRLILFWIIGSTFAFFSTPVTVQIPLSFFVSGDHQFSLDVWTTRRARAVMVEALRQGEDGALSIEMTPELKAHIARNPDFRYAAYDPITGRLAAGSSAELASRFRELIGYAEVFGSLFHLVNDPNPHSRGYIRTTNTKFGRLGTIVYGCRFHWDDLFYQTYAYIVLENVLSYLALVLVLSVVAFLVVRGALAPVRCAAATIGNVDANNLNQRLPTDEVPSEITPFVDAVNSAFERVRQGVARQKRFTANSAHELRTPIAILRGRVDKLQDSELKEDIERDVKRIQTILEQLLVLAQIEERTGSVVPPEVDLGEILLDATADYMPLALAADRQITYEAPENPVLVHAYRWAVESVATNLIENAVRAEPKGGTVVIRLTEHAVIHVVDHGEGVAKEHREMIFEPFWRKSEMTPGTGLGLAIARELVGKVNGSIWVEETPGGGATFKLRFPARNGLDRDSKGEHAKSWGSSR